jgi:hypothetical protein
MLCDIGLGWVLVFTVHRGEGAWEEEKSLVSSVLLLYFFPSECLRNLCWCIGLAWSHIIFESTVQGVCEVNIIPDERVFTSVDLC